MIQWHIVDSATFAAGNKIAGDMYFLSDTKQIYRGEDNFTTSIVLYNGTLPATYATDRLYIDSTTLAGYTHDDTEWKQVIKPVEDTFSAESDNPVSAKAIAAYVAAEIAKVSTSGQVINSLSWDSAEHILTVTSGSDTEDITFDGLGVSLSYVAATGTLQLLDASGNQIGDPIELAKDKFVTSGEYDADNKQIILYFDAEKTNSVTIDATGLVDIYTGEDSSSASIAVSTDNKITATVKISTEAGNLITLKDDGIYVSAPDMSDYMTKVPEATEGHLVTLDASGQVVDSGKSFADLASNAKVYKGESIEAATADQTPAQGDFCIVEKKIGETEKVELTAYYYDGLNWVAFDGNYSAENVYFPADLTTTSAIGNVALSNGQATVKVAGKNLIEAWNAIFVKEQNPKTNQPSVSLTANQNKAYEVGTTVTPTYTATLNPGSYSYGPATGVTATKWTVTNSDGGTADTNSGSFDAIEVGDNTAYTITATAEYGDGAIPVTNTGNEYAAGQIKAGSKSATSNKISGFRCGFWGYSETAVELSDIDSALIRALTGKSSGAMGNGSKGSINYPAGTKAVIIAYPATLRDLTSVIDVGGMNAEIVKAHDTTVDVEGANGYQAISYKVTMYSFAGDGASAANTYNFTV